MGTVVPPRPPGSRRRSPSPPSSGIYEAARDQLDLIMKEYKFLQSAIDKLDGQRFQIRNWAILASGALFTISLSARIPLVGFAGIVTTVFFAFLEVVYIDMVVEVIDRCDYLDKIINSYRHTGEIADTYIFGMSLAFAGTFSFRSSPGKVFKMGRIHVWAFYLGLLVVNTAGGLAATLR